jgi:hypothetical protein
MCAREETAMDLWARAGHGRWAGALVGALLLALPLAAGAAADSPGQGPPPLPAPSANVSVFATGLENPRQLTFGPDGDLYVAEGGRGGANSTAGRCAQVPDLGPYTGARTGGRISRIDAAGVRSTDTDTLPSSQTNAATGGLTSGVAAVAFLNGSLYALLAGAGCSHGVPDVPNGVVKVNADGTWSLVADLSAFLQAHPVAHPNPGDFEPDGTWYSMLAVGGALYALEPNHGELDRITPDGGISRVADISASQGHIVPTALAYRDGAFYVGNLSTFPVKVGASKVLKITLDGKVSVYATGLTTVLGLAFDPQGRLYAAETSTKDNADPTPGTGMVVRLAAGGGLETIASGLTFPTGMAFGPDGRLYVSNIGFGLPPGAGQVVRVAVAAATSSPAQAPAQIPAAMPNTGAGGGRDGSPRVPLLLLTVLAASAAARALVARPR